MTLIKIGYPDYQLFYFRDNKVQDTRNTTQKSLK